MGRRPQKLELTWFNKDQALIPTEEGKYGYTWVDPKDPRYCETHTLITEDVVRGEQAPKQDGITYSERADLAPTEDNLLIQGESGDVLEALTRVPELADKYVGQVKCIYIDPPFNTAQTFANYEDNLEHSIWLTMMRDRLIHLRQLLSDDGSIWVHLDDVENHRMRLLMDEVFGAGNFVAEVVWQKVGSPRMDAAGFSTNQDFIIVYRKTDAFSPKKSPADSDSNFSHSDEKGRYSLYPLRKWGSNSSRQDRPTMWYSIMAPDGSEVWPFKPDGNEGRWRWQRSTVEEKYSTLEWLDRGSGLQPYVKTYLTEDRMVPPMTWWEGREVGHNRSAKSEIKNLFPWEIPFATPKPERLLERIVHIATHPGDLVLDVFAGSGTTAAVAHKMGRRWVTCELVEDTMERFTQQRLTKVVRGEDLGGVTVTDERITKPGAIMPEKFETKNMQDAAKLLNAIQKDVNLTEDQVAALKVVKKLIDTVPKNTLNWRGGGSFTVARLSPSCFDYDPDLDLATLTEAATGQTLVASVAANMNFRLTPEHRYFHGIRGVMRLVVVEGRLDRSKADDLIAHLAEGEGLTIAATEIDDGVRQYLRGLGRGCRAVHIPSEIFSYSSEKEQ